MRPLTTVYKKYPFVIVALVFLLAAIASCSPQTLYSSPPVVGSNVVFEIAQLRPEIPVFFTYRLGDKNINFFVIDIRGKVQSFLDACVTCYPRKKGYRAEDDTVVCRACSQRFSVFTLEQGIGGCYPIKLAGRRAGTNYIIPVAAIEAQSDKF